MYQPSPLLAISFRRLWALDRFAQSMQVFVAMLGALILCVVQGHVSALVAPFLGIIAAALAESDDDWQGRLLSLATALPSFFIVCIGVECLFNYPVLLAIGLTIVTFLLMMLAALGTRWALVGMATLILAIYTMISIEQQHGVITHFWHEPLWLIGGSVWYGIVSIVWYAFFSHHPIKIRTANTLAQLGEYLILKSSLFEPVRHKDVEAIRIELATKNSQLITAFNDLKEALFSRLMRSQGSNRLNRYLRLYFIMQEIHERATSTHYHYTELSKAFFHSDILFRSQLLLMQQGNACKALGQSLLLGQPFDHQQSQQTLEDLNAAIDHAEGYASKEQRALLGSLKGMLHNLTGLEAQLALAKNPEQPDGRAGEVLVDHTLKGWREAWERLRTQCTLQSPIFRHACRLSLSMLVGFILLRWIHPTQGYWIILTLLFVCRPGYGATFSILRQRITGTVAGLILGWVLLTVFHVPIVQALVALIAGVAFFAYRISRYTLATAAITLMVLCCFNLIDNGFAFILPRLVDTLIGAVLAGLAVLFVLPDWQRVYLLPKAKATLTSSASYLEEILDQFVNGRSDTLAYRIARRNAHNADANFASLVSTLLKTPRRYQVSTEGALSFMVQTHSLLSHLSALGAHRENIRLSATDPLYQKGKAIIHRLQATGTKPSVTSTDIEYKMNPQEGEIKHTSDEILELEAEASTNPRQLAELQLQLIDLLITPISESLKELK